MYIKTMNNKKIIIHLVFILILSILFSGCIEDPTVYCEKHDCTYCEKDNDCTAMDFFEKMGCCQKLQVNKNIAVNIKSFNEKTKLEKRWYTLHCSFTKCKGIAFAPLLFPKVLCINNACTPFPTNVYEICTDNICMWNASWAEEHNIPFGIT